MNLTDNGTTTFDLDIGKKFILSARGTFGGGSLEFQESSDGSTWVTRSTVTTATEFVFFALAELGRVVLSGATSPSITLNIFPVSEQSSVMGGSLSFTIQNSGFTAENGKSYLAQGTFSVTDPAPVAGGIYTVLVSSGSVTIGGTAYRPSSLPVVRTSDGSTWTTVASPVQLTPSFIFPSGVSVYGNIPNSWKNGNATVTGLLIGNSVTSIGNYAFQNCSALTGSATIPNSVTTIGNFAFYSCSGLTGSLTLGNSVTTIGNYAFYNCSGLTGSLTLGNSVTSIGSYAFRGCSGLTGSATIPNSVTTIGSGAFQNCSALTGSLTIPNSVTSIGFYAFYNCSGLTSVNAYVSKSILNVFGALAGTAVTTIRARASDGTWTASSGQTIGGRTGITVIKDL